ncbi:hypothetical protein PR001_g23560 [Phytophthora rubi]|uniref:Integrase catalytic domain-containing protein n=1 Tax=Phytophthora rubi TaxID=129364 RepID=A0A6A3IQM0_9STRA|nr:hypothetical protein PR001_g23560 [Phytophthora rubi]
MTVFQEDDSLLDDSGLDVSDSETQTEFRLKAGEKFGWWNDNELDGDRKVAMVHGAVSHHRVPIMLDTGVTVNMVSADLARKLKLKLSVHGPLRVSGLGGVPTVIRSKAQVKLTICPKVVYILDVWVANIGEGIDALLGMDFMYSAGVRICAREGKLPDEEAIMLRRGGSIRKMHGLDLAVTPKSTLMLPPGEAKVVQIRYAQTDPRQDVVWAARGDRWVTKLIYSARSYPVAVKVVKISSRNLIISSQTSVARVVSRDSFPMAGCFVRPGSRKYLIWQRLIYESTFSDQMKLRIRRAAQIHDNQEPPSVQNLECPWPTQILKRSVPSIAEMRITHMSEEDSISAVLPLKDATVNMIISESQCPEGDVDMVKSGDDVFSDGRGDRLPGLESEHEDDDFFDARECIRSEDDSEDGDEYFDAISPDEFLNNDVPDVGDGYFDAIRLEEYHDEDVQDLGDDYFDAISPEEFPDEDVQDESFQKEGMDIGPESEPLPNAARVLTTLTRSGAPTGTPEDRWEAPLGPFEYQAERWRRNKVHPETEEYLSEMFSPESLHEIRRVADVIVSDFGDILYRIAQSTRDRPRNVAAQARLVDPKAFQSNIYHHAHNVWTPENVRSEFYSLGRYGDERLSEGYADCANRKVVSMDFVMHMSGATRGSIFLLLFQDTFSGEIMCTPVNSTTAQGVTTVNEKRVFWSLNANSLIQHDQDPRFMSEVFTTFGEILGSQQRSTPAYRLQDNDPQERSVQTVVGNIRAYITEANRSSWDGNADRLLLALNTSLDATRLETLFHLAYGWDAQGTESATLECRLSRIQEKEARFVGLTMKWKGLTERLNTDSERDEHEVEKIRDPRWSKRMRTSKRMLTSRRSREYLVKWKGYGDPSLFQLSCNALLYESNRRSTPGARFRVTHVGDDHPRV